MGPYKCPDCGVWWAGLEHRCRPTETVTSTASGCNCGEVRPTSPNDLSTNGWSYKPCPIHPIRAWY